ncbi:hypothetical protein BGX38DRAFT_1263141 [Terfezia claveryi]|nr:hypothetical protein BGX38DRAFT_1263141 [Terfezia claveryi]
MSAASTPTPSESTPKLQQVTSALPITSLSFLPSTHISESLLLSGEGPICKFYSPSTAQLLHTRRIFSREAIRGIAFEDSVFSSSPAPAPLNHGDEEEAEVEGGNRRIVFWGGHRIVVATLQELIGDSPITSASASLANLPPTVIPSSTMGSYTDAQVLMETPVKDYVHHAFFISRLGGSLVGVVTSHNLLLLYDPDARKWVSEKDMGERCILYSATGVYVPSESGEGGSVVVAAGTVFGEILVWSAPIDPPLPPVSESPPGAHSRTHSVDSEAWTELASDSEGEGWEELTKSTVLGSRAGTPKGHPRNKNRAVELQYRLKGHEGSIFGVDISPRYDSGDRKRYLVSCSDDRTVRVWDISRVDQNDEDGEVDGKLAESLAWDELGVDELRGTGFTSVEGTKGKEGPKSDCVAIGWGHQARIWNCRFLQKLSTSSSSIHPMINIVTTSEDLTSKIWGYNADLMTSTASLKPQNTQSVVELLCLSSTLLHSGKNVFALAIAENHKLLATGGHDGRIAIVSYDTGDGDPDEERYEWELDAPGNENVEMELEAIERNLAGLNITRARASLDKTESSGGKPKPSADQFRNYAVVDSNRYIVCTSKGYLAMYTFPTSKCPGRNSTPTAGGWRTLGQWVNLGGVSSVAVWQGVGLVAAQDRTGMVGIIDLDDFGDGGDEEGYDLKGKKGRWWQAGDGNPGLMFCGRHDDLFYLLTTSLLTPEVRLHLFPDPRVSSPSIRNSPNPPPRTKTIILCPSPNFHSVTSYHLDFAQGLLFLGSRSGVLCVFDVWSGVDTDVMLNPLESWKGWCDKDAITEIMAYPTQAGGVARQQQEGGDPRTQTFAPTPARTGLTRSSRILTTGRNGVYAILDVLLTPNAGSETSTSQITLTKLHIKKLLNGGSIEGAYHRIPSGGGGGSIGDLLVYGFRGKSFFVWNETRGYEVLSEECGGGHRSWVFHPTREGEGVGWFTWTQAGRMYVLRAKKARRALLQIGGHGREIKALAISPAPIGGGNKLIATGAEDTLIRLSVLRTEKTEKGKVVLGLKGVAVFKRHTTGVQHLEWSGCGKYLFSSGGVEEFYIWRVRRLNDPTGNKNKDAVGVVCEAACPVQSVVPDLRILGFDVSTVGVPWTEEGRGKAFLISMVYSDSSIKVWLYDPSGKTFRIVVQGRYKTSCLCQVKHFIHRRELTNLAANGYTEQHSTVGTYDSMFLLFVAGTDGYVTVYDITTSLRKAGISVTPLGATFPVSGEGPSGHGEGSLNPQPLPELIARPDLLTSPPPPTQLLPSPPMEGWTMKVHQSSVKSMEIFSLDVSASGSVGNRFGGYERPPYQAPWGGEGTGKVSVVMLTGGDDTAFVCSVFTITTWVEIGGDAGEHHHHQGGNGYHKQTTTWVLQNVPEAHTSAITGVTRVKKGKMRWSGDVDAAPVKEVSLGVVSVGVDRVVKGWDVGLLMGVESEVKVKVEERREVKGYSPVADISGVRELGEGLEGGRSGEVGARVVVVGVGVDVWDVVV